MGYKRITDFETGPLAAVWEHVVDGLRSRWQADSRRAAIRTRYLLYNFRVQARKAGHPLGEAADRFVIRLEEAPDGVWLVFEETNQTIGLKGLEGLRTARERAEERDAAQRAAALGARLIAEGQPSGGPSGGPSGQESEGLHDPYGLMPKR